MDKKKILIPIFLILLIGIIGGIVILSNTDKKNDTPKNPTTTTTRTTKNTSNNISPVLITVILEINPKLALELNDQEVVVNMYPLNDDAKQFTREAYIGKNLEDSIEKVMDDAKDYIDTNKKITVSVNRGETSFTESKILSIKSKVVNKIKQEDTTIKVEEKELSTNEITEVIEDIKDIKKEDIKPENITTTTTTIATTTSTTVTTTVTTTTTKKTTTTMKPTTTKKPDYNLNDNIKIMVTEGDLAGIYVYPNKEECKGKSPWDITIPEGETYNTYCENKIPSQPKLTGKGYYCETTTTGMINEDGITSSKTYKCSWIEDIVKEATVKKAVDKILDKSNKFGLGGGFGGVSEITLDEAACKKYSLSCGRW